MVAKKGLAGYNDTKIELVNDTKMFVAFSSYSAGPHKWGVLMVVPYDDVFASAISTRNSSYLIAGFMVVVIAVAAGFQYRSDKAKLNLAGHLKQANYQLTHANMQLKNTNKQLENIERAKEEFISMISHELKTPLTPIKGYAQMLEDPALIGSLNETQLEVIRSISKNVLKLEGLIRDLMDVYKLDIKKMKFKKREVDIKKLINESLIDLKSLTLDKNVELDVQFETEGSVFCDPDRVEQVLSNLVKNSIDFVPNNGGKIVIRAEKDWEDSKVVFAVEDNGSGIPVDKVDSLFQKFYQIYTSATRKHGGTGLGLVISKGIVEAHGGKIWVDKNYTNGACLRFTLPARKDVE